MTMIDKLKQQILNISKELGLSHIGSNISALPIYLEIYEKKKPQDILIACNAHSHLAHLIVEYRSDTAYKEIVTNLIKKYGIHCDRKAGCDASGGSLGHGLGIGIGYALANRVRHVYVILSEGSVMEGSTWEALRTAEFLKLKNITVYCNFNGYSAVAEIDQEWLERALRNYAPSLDLKIWHTENGKGFEGLQGHYKVLEK